MTLTPGTFPWLVAHDIRLSWRNFSTTLSAVSGRLPVLLVAVAVIVLHAIAFPLVSWLSPYLLGPEAHRSLLATVLTCTFTWMLAQSLFGTARTLYVRGDLDLLLGSPVPPRAIVAAKAAGIAANCLGSLALLAIPLANAGAIADSTAWLGIYPTLVSLALIASALGLTLSIVLFQIFGAGRARLWTQMIGALIAGAFVLGAQIVAMLPAPIRLAITSWLETRLAADASGPFTLLRLPMDSFSGDPTASLQLLLIASVAFVAATSLLGNRFAAMSIVASCAASTTAPTSGPARKISFRSGLSQNMWRKEWRLLARDPGMFAQLALQIIYTVPVAVVLLRNETLPPVFALAPTIVVIAAQVAASLAWLTVSGEDAPELIATAPVTIDAVNRAKLHSVALPVLIVLALPIAALAVVSWRGALITVVTAIAAGTSTAMLNLWHPMPGNRRGMLRRHSQSKIVALLEHGIALLWALAVVMALIGSPITFVPVLVVVAILAAMRHRGRKAHP
jgi:ABC-2 type transport system permease protein